MIRLTLITSKTVITKKFRLRGQALEKMQPGAMYAGHADALEVPDLQALIPIIDSMTTRQALAYGTITVGKITVPGDRHQVVTKDRQIDGANISRSRKFFEFKDGQEGIILIDYDPQKNEKPLGVEDVMQMLVKVCPAISTSEKLIVSSASSYLYRKSDNECLKGAGGLHILVRVANASEIPGIGKALDARLWLAGLGYIGKTADDKDQVRSLIDTSVWQPERLSYECGSECGAGLEQRKPAIQHVPGGALSLADVAISEEDWDKYNALVAGAKGQKPPKKSASRAAAAKPAAKTAAKQAPVTAEPLTPERTARIMGALLHVPPTVDYQTWITIGMALKTGCGDAGFQIWDNWSKPAASYPGSHALRAKWVSFDSGHVTIRTLFYHAKQYGWTGKPARVDIPLPARELPEDQHEPLAAVVSVETAQQMTFKNICDRLIDHPSRHPHGMQNTVGTGKSTALREAFTLIREAGLTITCAVKDKQQCAVYEKSGAFWRHGREATEEGFTPETPWHCPKAEAGGAVERLASQEHRLQQMCKSGHCEHGNKMMLLRAKERGEQPKENIVRFFKERPEMMNVAPCAWFGHMGESVKRAVRVLTGAGLSLADLVDKDGLDIDGLVVDEAVKWAHSQMLDVPQVRVYIELLQKLIERDKEAEKALETPIAVFQSLARQMGEHAATAAAGVYSPVTFDMSGIVDLLSVACDEHGMAPWEKPQWKHWTELVQAPLRALAAIRDGIAANSLSLCDGALHITYLHPVLAHAIRRGIPVLVMDATLDPTARGFISDEHIQRVVADPNLDWVIDPRWFFSSKNDEESLKKEQGQVMHLRKKQESETELDSYIIARKALAIFMLSQITGMDENELENMPRDELWQLTIDERIGWWGWHETAHDEWKGLNGILWGQIPTPDSVRLREYMDHRACLLLTGNTNGKALPLADNVWTQKKMIKTGTHEQQSMARLPEQPEVRQWLLETVSAMKIQGAGRSRAASRPCRMTIWQVGGYPMTGLAEHGIRPSYQRLVKGLSGNEVAALRSAQRRQLITEAAALAIASRRQISRTTVREFAEGICNSLIANKSSGNRTDRDGYIYIYRSRSVLSSLESNENSNLQAALFTNDDDGGVWTDEYNAWRADAPAGMSLHFARGAKKPMPVQAQAVQHTAPACGIIRYSPESENIFKPDPDEAEPEEQEQITASGPETIDFTVVTDTQEDDTMMQAYMEYAATAQADDQPIIPLSTRDQHIADMLELGGDDEPVAWFKSELLLCADAAERQVLHGLIKEFSHD